MNASQYRAAIKRLGLSQRAAGDFLSVCERTSRRWAAEDNAVPESAAKLLRLVIARNLKPGEVK